MGYLIFVRHGESRWNKSNRFTGWVDVPLSELGVKEAMASAVELCNLKIHIAFTSTLRRAQETLLIILSMQCLTGVFQHTRDKEKKRYQYVNQSHAKDIPIYSNPLLNERHYGDIQGMNKQQARRKYNSEKVFQWRRSFEKRPPHGESLEDVYKRAVPFFRKNILQKAKKNNIIVSCHGNTLRALIKYLENIPNDKIPHLELPYGKPIIYQYEKGKLVRKNRELTFNRPILWDHEKGK